ncbi:MAG TPA: D-alanine--D-alanine ligase [Candidatus Omnitrophota bacterium]|nr:D-alanine--D-alanine ligase [Candidatus Omnitrophota bacterium]
MAQNVKEMGHIGVLMGGPSSEREISLKSGQAVLLALQEEGCHVSPIFIDTDDEKALLSQLQQAAIDVAFLALHGRFGEDGTIQAILDKANIIYTGSGVEASQRAFNKVVCQQLFQQNHIRVSRYAALRKNSGNPAKALAALKLPVFVKPSCEGSSIGISYAASKAELEAALALAWQYGEEVLVEEAIEGTEVTVGILDQAPLPIVEICPKNKFFDFKAKYEKGMTEYIVPARLSQEAAKAVQETALKAYKLLGCRHLARVDFMVDRKGQHYLLEVNTIPGFTATSLLPKAAKHAGINFNQLCLKLVGLAYGEKKKFTHLPSGR